MKQKLLIITDPILQTELSVVDGTVNGPDVLGKEFNSDEEEDLFTVKIHSVWDD